MTVYGFYTSWPGVVFSVRDFAVWSYLEEVLRIRRVLAVVGVVIDVVDVVVIGVASCSSGGY